MKANPTDSKESKLKRDALHMAIKTRISSILEPMGYELVTLEVLYGRSPQLVLYIDFANIDARDLAESSAAGQAVGIEDCVKVTHELSVPLETMPELELLFPDSYELIVSSPGLERPLARPKDFERFRGRKAKVQTERPLVAVELNNEAYLSKNPRQRNFVGELNGFRDDKVLMTVPFGKETSQIEIPFSLVTRAHLEPDYEQVFQERKK